MTSVSLALQSPTCVTKTLVVILLISGTARIDRVDPGTENVKVEVLQKFFRTNGRDRLQLFRGKKFYVRKIHSKSGKNNDRQILVIVAGYTFGADISLRCRS